MPDEAGLREAAQNVVDSEDSRRRANDRDNHLGPAIEALRAALRSTPAAPEPNEHVYSCCPHEDAAPQPDTALTVERLGEALKTHWLDTPWGSHHCGDDPEHECATAILRALNTPNKENGS